MNKYYSTHDTYIDMGVLGDQNVTVRFDYQPEERQTCDDQGYTASIDVTEVIWRGVDVLADLPTDVVTELEIEVLERTEEGDCDED